jgi:uncharacterized protein (DUF1778 family)
MTEPKRTVVMTFRLTEEEAAVIKAAADFYGITVSELGREACLCKAQRPLAITFNGVRIPA